MDLEVFEAFADGFLKNTAAALTKTEIDTLAQSCLALTAELSVRFLDDYIQGDPYFKINYPKHNLVRSRCQMALAKDMERKMDTMDAHRPPMRRQISLREMTGPRAVYPNCMGARLRMEGWGAGIDY